MSSSSVMKRTIQTGIVGTGFMGTVHARAVARAGAQLVAVAGRDLGKMGAATQDQGGTRFSRSAEDLITDPDVEVVHICTPNHLHAPLAELALKAKKHVVCEKPLATNTADAARLAALAAASGLVAAVPFVYRYYPTVREARARILRGDAGHVHLLHGSYLQDWLASSTDTNWRVDPALGGASRAFGDIGIHWCDLLEFVTGHRIRALVSAVATPVSARKRGRGSAADAVPVSTEDVATVIFTTDQGATGSLIVSQVSLGRRNRLWFSVDGETAAYTFDQEAPETLWVGGRDCATIIPRGSAAMSAQAQAYTRVPAGHPQGYQDCFDAFVADVYSAVQGGAPDGLPTFADGLRSSRIVDAVMSSASSAQWVEVTS